MYVCMYMYIKQSFTEVKVMGGKTQPIRTFNPKRRC